MAIYGGGGASKYASGYASGYASKGESVAGETRQVFTFSKSPHIFSAENLCRFLERLRALLILETEKDRFKRQNSPPHSRSHPRYA